MALVPATSVGGGSGGLTQVADTIAGGAVASLDVQGIAPSFNHLQLVLNLRGDTAATTTGLIIRFNNDSAGNYEQQGVFGINAAVSAIPSVGTTGISGPDVPAGSATAGRTASFVVMVPDYASTTFNKTAIGNGGEGFSAANASQEAVVFKGTWLNTAAITRVTVLLGAGNIIAGSRLTIYGLT